MRNTPGENGAVRGRGRYGHRSADRGAARQARQERRMAYEEGSVWGRFLGGQGQNHRRVVAGLLVLAGCAVNVAGAGLWFERIADQDVVNAQAAVFLETQHAVIPPRKTFFRLLKQAKTVVQPQAQQRLKMGTLFGRMVNGAGQANGVK